jgi:alpha-1,2-mannosyltransferase
MAAPHSELLRPAGGMPARPADSRRGLIACAGVFAALLGLYVADMIAHPVLLDWFDLHVYLDAGRVAESEPGRLYQVTVDFRQFTYTPFAALIFAGLTHLPRTALGYWVTGVSLLSVPVTSWLVFGGLGWRGARRLGGALVLAGFSLWLEPLQRALQLGQIEPLLMLLIVWDLCQPDARRLKGTGVGVAAGIKLVPLIFIPYLLLAGRIRQAVTAAVAFAVTAVTGWVFLPGTFSGYWLSGYFVHPHGIGMITGIRNQSVNAILIQLAGSVSGARPAWIAVSAVVGVAGILAAAVLHRSGQPVAGWATCALTGLLISPVSWDHHWVWLLPLAAVLTGWAVRSRGAAARAWWAATAILGLLFAAYPNAVHGRLAYDPQGGLLGVVSDQPLVSHAAGLHPAMLLTRNVFILCGVVLFAVLLAVAWRARTRTWPAMS